MGKDLEKENKHLKENFDILKKEATKINGDLEKKNEDLKSDIGLLNKEIAEIKKSDKSNKKEVPEKILTPKEKGYTQISDLKSYQEQSVKNAPKRNKK